MEQRLDIRFHAIIVSFLDELKLLLSCNHRVIDQTLLYLELERRVEAVITGIHEVAKIGREVEVSDVIVSKPFLKLGALPALLIISKKYITRY
jgi:hypothetical protein